MFTLDKVVPWGRSFAEYRRMFALSDADLGLTIVPRATVQNEVRSGTLRAINFTESFARPIGIIYRKGKIFSGAARKFVEMLTERQQVSS